MVLNMIHGPNSTMRHIHSVFFFSATLVAINQIAYLLRTKFACFLFRPMHFCVRQDEENMSPVNMKSRNNVPWTNIKKSSARPIPVILNPHAVVPLWNVPIRLGSTFWSCCSLDAQIVFRSQVWSNKTGGWGYKPKALRPGIQAQHKAPVLFLCS